MSHTMTETGMVLTETREGVTMPADYSFAAVNDYVHGVDRFFEELQWLALGMDGVPRGRLQRATGPADRVGVNDCPGQGKGSKTNP